ncbi:MAG: leucine-rich repeat domain-containing protein [Desulfurellaceae bacterium]|nr:leucine-rich repeat domain-containing protein [Desulfurellaceae bacterium]
MSTVLRPNWVRCFIFVCVAVLCGGPLVAVGGAQEEGDLRVPGGGAGRLEVYRAGQWGTVCDDRFTNDTAGVACRQLGYTSGTFYQAGGGSGPIWLDSVECEGDEARLADCDHDGWGIHDCSHNEDVGVSCELDTTAAVFTVSVSDTEIAEGESTTLTVAITNGVTFTQDLPIRLDFGGSAAANDFTAPATLTLAAGNASVTATLSAADDIYAENAETIAVTARQGTRTLGQATVTISAGGPTGAFSVSVSDTEIAEGESTTLTVAITNGVTFTRPLTIRLDFGGSAAANDFTAPATLTLAAGNTSVTATLSAVDDIYKEDAETIAITAHGSRTLGQATVTISASDPTGSTLSEGDLRLQGGTALAGRLEVHHAGQWGTVCHESFRLPQENTHHVAEVACRQLGYTGGTAYTAGGGSGRIWLDSVECEGDEARLDACDHDGWGVHDCSHAEDLGVSCDLNTTAAAFSVSVSDTEIAEGESTTLTVAITNGVTFTQDLPVALTFDGSAAASDFTAPTPLTLAAGNASATATLSAVDDAYKENAETIAVTARHGTRTLGQATVTISASDLTGSTPIEGSLRLQGDTDLRGRLEVYHAGQWGTVCDDRLLNVSAEVACRQLGHAGGTAHRQSRDDRSGPAWLSVGSGPIWLDSVECEGDEARLDACPHDGWGIHDCSHSEDVGVSCEAATSLQMSPALPPLTARFDPAPPATHTGSGTFTVRIRFSADITIGKKKLRRRGLRVTGGTVTRAWRAKGRSDLWKIRIRPTAADVTIVVPANRACNAAGALCTADGRQLATRLAHTVRGPTTPLQSPQRATRRAPDAIAPPSKPVMDPLEIPDAALHTALEQALGTAPGVSLTAADLAAVTTLDLSGAGITDLTGLEQAHNLETLFAADNRITDLSPLADLVHLKSLSLGGNRITDLSPLADLVHLEFLSLADNRITDLSPLAELVRLELLFVAGNRITDFSPLAGLPRVSIDGQDAQTHTVGAE